MAVLAKTTADLCLRTPDPQVISKWQQMVVLAHSLAVVKLPAPKSNEYMKMMLTIILQSCDDEAVHV